MKQDKRPVTVEDLLRLKRAERPADDFWLEFDRQLRAKQLSALVEKRPWWRSVSFAGLWGGFRRYPVPLGAAAVLAVSVVSYRANQFPIQVSVVLPANSMLEATSAESGLPAGGTGIQGESPLVVAEAVGNSDSGGLETRREHEIHLSLARSDSPTALPSFTSVAPEPSGFVSPAAAALAVDSAWSGGSLVEPVLSRSLLATSTRFEARALPARPVVEPLKQITPPSERRGTRILTAMVSMASVENAMRTTERTASRLSEEQLYDQIRRVGAFGAGVNVKF